ncbi:response regulator transcription factor [Daejeonella oryzae]|uniref:response regulator transcription factor n=1 Tax=Daejeonella oryzae TaxID=1122943 RepID=UPI00040E618B|nr:response regulator transcription factor [Daejeonella oryzae]
MKVLIVEDEKTLAFEVEAFLKKAFYICDKAHTGKKALEMLDLNLYDFVLLDLGLPDTDGLTLLTEARKLNPDAACIILTARGNIEDRIKGLDLGADDYLPKPFSLPELQSRMQAISRRKYGIKNECIPIGEFEIDLQNRTLFKGKDQVDLTKKEFDLLSYMLLHKNRVLTRMQLSEHIWGSFTDYDSDSNYIDVHIKNIRKKMANYAAVDWLETVRGVGYKIKKQA